MIDESRRFPRAAHGGEVERVAREHDLAVEDLLDFSANINPEPPPRKLLTRLTKDARDVGLLRRYPDASFHELRRAISSHHVVAEDAIVIANGSAALIDAAVRAAALDADTTPECLLPVPAFSEYERALTAANCAAIKFPLCAEDEFVLRVDKFADELVRRKPRLCIINNPHNPTGSLLSRVEVEKIVAGARETRTVVLLDEAFIDYATNESLISAVSNHENLIVMRSVTKFYSVPALRVGFAVCASPAAANEMSRQLPSWSVTTLAANAASEIYRDEAFARRTRRRNEIEKRWLTANLRKLGIKVYPSAANFLLLELNARDSSFAEFLRRLVVEHKIIVRDCSTYENLEKNRFVRVAVLSRRSNERLVSALSAFEFLPY